MFLSACSPMSSKASSSLPAASSHPRGDADPARLGQPLEAGGDIDAVAKDVAVLDDDVAHVDPDTKLDAVVGSCAGVALGHLALHFDRAAQRVDDAAELDQQPITGGFDQAAAVL